MDTVIEGLKVVFFGALLFSIIVAVHEAGHFTAARLFGLRVKEFMIGLPGPNIGFKFKGTKFGVTPFLLGGYALIAGDNSARENTHLVSALSYLAFRGTLTEDEALAAEPELGYDLIEALDILHAWGTVVRVKKKGAYTYRMPETESAAEGDARIIEDVAAHLAAERKLTFNAAPWYKRVIILAAGVIFNLVFAITVFTIVLMVLGTQVPTNTLATIVEGSPAQQIGLQPGDTVIALKGKAVDSWEGFVEEMQTCKPGDRVSLRIDRSGTVKEFSVTLADNEGRPMLGVTPAFAKKPIYFPEAFSNAVGTIGIVAEAILKLFNPATFNEVISQSSSVIGISYEAKNFAEEGFLPFIFLAAALSISIGLMNLLPFPPLDGGRIIVETIERVTRRRIPVTVMNGITVVAVALLILLFIYVTNLDIQRYILGN